MFFEVGVGSVHPPPVNHKSKPFLQGMVEDRLTGGDDKMEECQWSKAQSDDRLDMIQVNRGHLSFHLVLEGGHTPKRQ